MNLDQMTLTELKALAYDTRNVIERASNNLKVINQQIALKLKEKQMEYEVVATPEVADESVVEETPAAEEVAEEVAPAPEAE